LWGRADEVEEGFGGQADLLARGGAGGGLVGEVAEAVEGEVAGVLFDLLAPVLLQAADIGADFSEHRQRGERAELDEADIVRAAETHRRERGAGPGVDQGLDLGEDLIDGELLEAVGQGGGVDGHGGAFRRGVLNAEGAEITRRAQRGEGGKRRRDGEMEKQRREDRRELKEW
jgi:hypothetical protein